MPGGGGGVYLEKKYITVHTNILEKTSILERFLKDRVTVKTGVMAAENSAFFNTGMTL